jgi:hypothetical protein
MIVGGDKHQRQQAYRGDGRLWECLALAVQYGGHDKAARQLALLH